MGAEVQPIRPVFEGLRAAQLREAPAVLRRSDQPVFSEAVELVRRYTTNFQGLRSSLERYLRASGCFVVHFDSSQSMRSLLRSATLPSRHVVVDRWHFSIS